MDKITIELDYEQVEDIVRAALKDSLTSLEDDFRIAVSGGVVTSTGFFSNDPEEDLIEMDFLIKSLKKVISWYSIPGTEDEE